MDTVIEPPKVAKKLDYTVVTLTVSGITEDQMKLIRAAIEVWKQQEYGKYQADIDRFKDETLVDPYKTMYMKDENTEDDYHLTFVQESPYLAVPYAYIGELFRTYAPTSTSVGEKPIGYAFAAACPSGYKRINCSGLPCKKTSDGTCC